MVKRKIVSIFLTMVMLLSMFMIEGITVSGEVVTTEGSVSVAFGKKTEEKGIKMFETSSTQLTKTIGGQTGRLLSATDDTSLFLYCDVDDNFLKDIPNDTPIDITVEYYDAAGGGYLSICYDSYNPQPEFSSANAVYKASEPLYLEGTETWRTHTWTLEDMRMSNRCNSVADFRVCTWDIFRRYSKTDVVVKSVKVSFGEFKNPTNVDVTSPERLGNIFSDRDETINLNVNVQNKTYNPVKGEYDVRIYDKLTQQEVYKEKFELGADARTTDVKEMSFPNPGRNTIYTIEINETVWEEPTPDNKKTNTIYSECSVAMLAQEGEHNPYFGNMSSVVLHHKGLPEETYKLMRQGGMTWGREDYSWSKIETVKGQLVLPESVKAAWKQMQEDGIKLIYVCLGTNPLYEGGKTPVSDEAINAYANYCAFMARELKGITDYFEIWNEWNIVNFNPSNEPPETYAKLCKAAYTAIKKENPNAKVIGVSTALIDINWTRRVFEAGAYDYMDMVSIHPYDFSGKFREEKFIKDGFDLINLMKEYGEVKPICYSELGFSTMDGPSEVHPGYGGYSQSQQSAAKILSNALIRAYGIADILIEYEFYDRGDQKDIEQCWGLLYSWRQSEQHKPRVGAKESYLTTAAMNRIWGANTDYKDKIVHDRAYAMNFYNNKDERNVLVLATGEGEQTLNIDLGINAVDLYDMYGNKMSTLCSDNGVYAFGVSMIPYYAIGKFEKFEESTKQGAIVPDSITQIGTANDVLSFNLTKNINEDLTVEVGEISGATVIANEGFVGDTATITLRTDKSVIGERVVPITVKDKNGKIYYYAEHRMQLKDPISISISAEKISESNNIHWAAKIKVHNNSQEGTHSGNVILKSPEETAATARARSFKDIPPGKDAVFLFNLPVRITKQPIDVAVDVKLDGGLEFSAEEKLTFTTAKYATQKPVIDGVMGIGEWEADWFGVAEKKFVKMIEDWKGPDDVSFNATMMWDEENVYMLAVVRDSIHCVQYSPSDISNMWRGDGIQFSIDDRDVVPAAQEGEFTELGLAELPNGKSGAYRWTSLYDGLKEQTQIENVDVAVKHDNGVTTYECRMPWSEIFYDGYEVNPDGTFRFSALINDNDGAGRRGWIEYMSGIGSPKNAGMFGKLILEK